MGKGNRATAIVFAAVMLAPTLLVVPPAVAYHQQDTQIQDFPAITYDGSRCFLTRLADLPRDAQDLEPDQRAFWRWVTHNGARVPALCVSLAEPQYVELVKTVGAIVEAANEAIFLLENQTAYRREIYIPQNRTTILKDEFDGRRTGGYGDWSVVTLAGRKSDDTPADFAIAEIRERYLDPDVGYAFRDPNGYYPAAAEVALVSPELDLGAADAPGAEGQFCSPTGTCYDSVTAVRQQFDATVGAALGSTDFGGAVRALRDVVAYYENSAIVTLSMRHRYNLAAGADGVRLEVYTTPPTTDILNKMITEGPNATLHRHLVQPTPPPCEEEVVDGVERSVPTLHPIQYDYLASGCVPVASNAQGGTLAYNAGSAPLTFPSDDQYGLPVNGDCTLTRDQYPVREGANGPPSQFGDSGGFTGSSRDPCKSPDDGWINATYDLSRFAGKTVWLVWRVKTGFAEAEDHFTGDAHFPIKGDYGYFLDSVNVTAKAKLHNLRVKAEWNPDAANRAATRVADVASPDLPLPNEVTGAIEQTLVPPMTKSGVSFYVTNFGRYEEKVKATIEVRKGTQAFGEATQTRVLRPGEVFTPTFVWPKHKPAATGDTYTFTVSAVIVDPSAPTPDPTGFASVDPNGSVTVNDEAFESDPWQPRDEAYYRVDHDNTASVTMKAREKRSIELVRMPGVTNRVIIEPAVEKKDELRSVSVRVANTGNTLENVLVQPTIADGEGRSFPDYFLDEAAREIGWLAPGEFVDLSWTLRPYITGTYRLNFTFLNASKVGETITKAPTAALYVGRTSGIVCEDDLAFRRRCVPGFEREEVGILRDGAFNGAWISPDGRAWLVGDRGAAFARGPDGWVNLSENSSHYLRVPPNISVLGALAQKSEVDFLDVDGVDDKLVYVVGSLGTVLRYNGTWSQGIVLDRATQSAGDATSPDLNPQLIRDFTTVLALNDTIVFIANANGQIFELAKNVTLPAGIEFAFEPAENVTASIGGRAILDMTGNLSEVWAVGQSGLILKWNGTRWSAGHAPAGISSIHLNAIAHVGDGVYVAGGASGLIVAYDPVVQGWTVNRTAEFGAPAVRGFAVTRDALWALGDDGLALRCDRCLDGGGWTAVTPSVPFVETESTPPRLVSGGHESTKGSLQGSPEVDDDFDFRVTYVDREGDRPDAVSLKYMLSGGAAVTTKAMTHAGGRFDEGARYAVTIPDLAAGRYTYWFEATNPADGHVQTSDVVDNLTVGGDCRTGADGAATSTSANRIFPDHSDVFCDGALDGSSDVDGFRFRVHEDQSVTVEATATSAIAGGSSVTPPPLRVELTTSSDDTVLAESDSGSLTYSPDVTRHYVAKISVPSGTYDEVAYDLEVRLVTEGGDVTTYRIDASSPAYDTTLEHTLADVTATASGVAGEAIAATQSGYLLRYLDDFLFENLGDWDTDHYLKPTGMGDPADPKNLWGSQPVAWWAGTAVGTSAGSLRASIQEGLLTDPQTHLHGDGLKPTAWTAMPLTIRHQIPYLYSDGSAYPQIRLAFVVTGENLNPGVLDFNCPGGTAPQTCQIRYSNVTTFIEPTKVGGTEVGGYVEETIDLLPFINDARYLNPSLRFAGVDFFYPNPNGTDPRRTTHWIIDEINLTGITPSEERTLVHWHGRDIVGETRPYWFDEARKIFNDELRAPWALHPRPVDGCIGDSKKFQGDTLGDCKVGSSFFEGGSLWRLSRETDSSAWVSNFETLGDSGPGIGSKHGYKGMLLTPAIDLRQTFEPVLEFKHAFVGRVVSEAECLRIVDLGSVMMQIYDEDTGHWSRMYRVDPEGGYPGRAANRLPDVPTCNRNQGDLASFYDYGQGWFGANVEPDPLGEFRDARRIENWETVRIRLNDQPHPVFDHYDRERATQPESVPNGGGGIVRFAFVHNVSQYKVEADEKVRKYEGWYVSGVRVIGERLLGNDLLVTNLSLNVGYDWQRIGVGPETVVPVNLTVENKGRYGVPGFTSKIEIHKIIDPVRRLTRVVAQDEMPYAATIQPGESRNFTLRWVVGANAVDATAPDVCDPIDCYIVKATIVPMQLPDENDADNVAQIGDLTRPVVARRHVDVRVIVDADPRAESASVTRYLPIYVDNVGNVPVSDLIIRRSIERLQGADGRIAIPDASREWKTELPAPEGARTLLSVLTSEVDVLDDLYWTPPSQANFLVSVSLENPASTSDRFRTSEILVESFTTYLFDDFEQDGPRGVSFFGAWEKSTGWDLSSSGGFGDTGRAYVFGDTTSLTYPAGADSSLELPLVELSSANTARLSFRHKFDFEEGYDGGLVEASLDDGKSWIVLTPNANPQFGLPEGYPKTPLSQATPLDPSSHPLNVTRAFTGSSRDLPNAVDGWILSEFNLGQIEALVKDTAYEAFDAQRQRSTTLTPCVFDAACDPFEPPYYADSSWLVGAPEDFRYYQVDNLTLERVTPTDPTIGFLWSGSPRLDDDETAPENPALRIPVDLTGVSPTSPRKVELRYREWMRHDAVEYETVGSLPPGTYDRVIKLEDGGDTQLVTWRAPGDGDYYVAERDGNWWTWAVDLTKHKGTVLNLTFAYANLDENGFPTASAPSAWGWIIDDFRVVNYTEFGGLRTENLMIGMEDLTTLAYTVDCVATDSEKMPCVQSDEKLGSIRLAKEGVQGEDWTFVHGLNSTATQWSVLGLDNAADAPYVNEMRSWTGSKLLPTGDENRIWWSGRKAIHDDGTANTNVYANTPGGLDSRLVTPTIDLARIAGNSARLEFKHLYAFFSNNLPTTQVSPDPQTYGDVGVIEIQAFNRETNEWGEWQQVYKRYDDLSDWEDAGGYPDALPRKYIGTQTGRPVFAELDLPSHYNDTTGAEYVYAYAGHSTADYPGSKDTFGWVPESFDLTPWLGERVRVGFRYITAADAVTRVPGTGAFATDDTGLGGFGPGQGGWWIDDIEVRGDTLAGQSVRLRLRAGTDDSSNCHTIIDDSDAHAAPRCEGGWSVDDVALSGTTYRRNVGIFLTEQPAGVGAGRTVEIEGVLRNLADGVRRNLAVEIRDATTRAGIAPTPYLEFEPLVDAGRGTAVIHDDGEAPPIAFVSGLNLPPGGSAPFRFRVTAPDDIGNDARRILVRVVEYNEVKNAFLPVTGNEVKGFAARDFILETVTTAEVTYLGAGPSPKAIDLGATTTLSFDVENTGRIPVTLAATCEVRRIENHGPVNYGDPGALPDVQYGPARACAPKDARPSVAPGESGSILYTFRPTTAGWYEARIKGTFTDDLGQNTADVVTGHVDGAVFRFLVGEDPFYLKDDLEDRHRRSKFESTSSPTTSWQADEARAHSGEWSFRGGLPDAQYASSTSATYASPFSGSTGESFTLTTPPLDLHNVSTGPVYLRFWHMPRLALGDGAGVEAEILVNEFQTGIGWQPSDGKCRIHPVGGYDGPVYSYFSPTDGDYQPDVNAAFPDGQAIAQETKRRGWYASNDPTALGNRPNDNLITKSAEEIAKQIYFTGFSNEWRLAEFDLSQAECTIDENDGGQRNESLLGHTVRFRFTVYTGAADPTTCPVPPSIQRCHPDHMRGRGQGWFIDDLHVSEYGFDLVPSDGEFFLRDNSTKLFPSLIANTGAHAQDVTVSVDTDASSIPKGAARAYSEATNLDAGESTLAWTEIGIGRDPGLLPLRYQVKVLAMSGADPNAVKSRVINLTFAPRHWPDLRVSVEPPAQAVQEGTKAYIPITIENYGLKTSPAPRITIVETFRDETKVHEIPASQLPPIPTYTADPLGSTVITEFLWSPIPGRGTHDLRVIVDPDGLIDEYTKSDNVADLKVDVSKLLQPDLAVNDASLTVRLAGVRLDGERDGDVVRYAAEENDLVTLELAVRNEGPVGATNVDVRAFIGPLSLPPKTLPFVPAGAEVVVPFTWLAQKGEWAIQFTTRTDLVELDGANNRLPRQGLVLLTVKGFDVTVDVPDVDGLLEPGAERTLPVTLTNPGISGEEVRLRATLPVGWSGGFEETTFFLAKGRVGDNALTVPLTIRVGDLAEAGEQVITVEAVATENPLKASRDEAAARVRAVYGVALEAPPAPAAARPGRVEVPFVVENVGNSREPIAVAVGLPSGWTLAEHSPASIIVAPFSRESEFVAVQVPPGTRIGTYDVDVTLTLPDGETESIRIPVRIREWRQVAFSVESAEPTNGVDRLRYDVRITNVGNVRAPFVLMSPDLPEGWRVTVTPDQAVLEPGASLDAVLEIEPADGVAADEYPIPLYAHFDGVQPLSAEGLANRDRVMVRIVRPDVAVREFEFLPRIDIEPLTRVRVHGAVENVGSSIVSDVTASLFVDDVFIEAIEVDRLMPGERRELYFNWTAVGGEHSMTIVADPFRDALDVDRDNNAATRVIHVLGEQQTVRGAPAGTVDTPGFGGLAGILAGVAASFLVARRPWRSTKK